MTPATRKATAKEAKQEQILDLAERQLMAGGYGRLSIVGIARELGVAANTIYWYFPSKDNLFVAALQRLSMRLVQAKPPHAEGFSAQAVWFVDQLAELRPVRIAVHERARSSKVVADYEVGFQRQLRGMLEGGLREQLPAAEVDGAADLFLATVEGLLVTGKSPAERLQILERLLRGLGINQARA
jgi:AcrR family transcriptional regulator